MERDEPRPRPGLDAKLSPGVGHRRSRRPDLGLRLALAALVGTAALCGGVATVGSPQTAVSAIGILGIVLALCALVLGRTIVGYGRVKHQIAQLEAQRTIDALTGLARFHDVAASAPADADPMKPGTSIGLLVCDLDRLHLINAADGHPVGDDMIRIAANRMQAELDGRHALFRAYGDQLVVVAHDLPTERDLELLAERVQGAVGRPVTTTSGLVRTPTMSVGIASRFGGPSGRPGRNGGVLVDLIGEAEIACRRASESGGGRCEVFQPSHRTELLAPAQLSIELREAVHQEQLEVHYQPIIDARTGVVDRLEALVRWRHPVRRLVLPGAFLQAAADSDLIHEIGEFVLQAACRQAVEWTSRLGRAIVVSVNLDAKQLLDPTLVTTVGETLAATGLPPNQLELEIGEGVIEGQHHAATVAMSQLQSLNVRLALDGADVGTATLANLAVLPMLSTVKLSPAVADTMASTPLEQGVAGAVAAQANSCGFDIVVVGLERPEQVAGAMAGADVAAPSGPKRLLQGFALNRPAPADRLHQILVDGCPLVTELVPPKGAACVDPSTTVPSIR